MLGYQLAATTPHLRLYVVGEENLKIELREHGLTIHPELWDQNDQHVINPNGIDAVIVAFDRTFDYRKLNTAYQALLHGARYFATNPDKTCPMPGGAIPDAGVTIAALKVLTGREPEIVAGKPSRLMVEVAMKRLGLPPDRCLMVGDRLETDIRMGKDAGMYAAVVLTGSSTRQQVLDATPKPDLMLNNLTELYDLIRQSSH